MKFQDIKVGDMVQDRCYPEKYYGKVIKKLKTRIKINTSRDGIITYDKSHVQFLDRMSNLNSSSIYPNPKFKKKLRGK
jgi:hypothetical protein